jgi:CheY-like chemotaxis protein
MSKILVVDDRPDARHSMTCPLAAAGFDVRETATGREALRLARLQADAIVLDLILRDMDGYEVLRQLKIDPATRDIPVILKTADQIEGYRELGLELGAPPVSRNLSTAKRSSLPCASYLAHHPPECEPSACDEGGQRQLHESSRLA